MQPEDSESPREIGRRTAGGLLLAAAILFPFISIVDRLMPSRENTIIDELPADALTIVVIGLTVAGLARMGYALVVDRRRQRLAEHDSPRIGEPPAAERIKALQRERLEVRDE